ncbi:Transcription factor MADS-box [Arabidopsis thaliana x Arabidopsis arenosa]|uniref:Transcription factor MADS-box n=1 Tax=Arabidopsis thaliana x Arabidopsis arenosa TaxID=1240361 RepID=A0A8T1XNV3_9BRAS|nr:Transcription factor MADS-box [Arabidopsis thaliana x Arabidopsis arenosa]
MGRRRVEIKRIENKSSRQVTFCKRRNGLMEKARQLSVLCESSVALFIVSSTGKLYSFSSGDSMAKILSRFEIHQAGDLKTLDLAEKTQDYLSHKELLEIVQSKLEEAKGDNVSIESLTSMEEQLKSALSVTRARKTELLMELVKNLQDKEKLLKEENKVLASQMEKLKKFSETEDERALSPENSSDHNPPETLPLLK